MPLPSSLTPSTLLSRPDETAGTIVWTPEVLTRNPTQPGVMRADDFARYVSFFDDNPFTREKVIASTAEFNGLFAPNPMFSKMLAPGYPSRIAAFKSWRNTEATLHTPVSDPSLTFGAGGKIGTKGYQTTWTKLNAGLSYHSIEQMSVVGAMRAAGFPSPEDIALEQVAVAWGLESTRMPFAMLLAMLQADFLKKNVPYGDYRRSNFVLDISADTSDDKYLVLLFGGPAINYETTTSPEQDNDGHPPMEVIRDGRPGYGAGQRMYIERRKFLCHPVGFSWRGGAEDDVYPTREELLDFENNWTRIQGAERHQYPFGAIIVNGEQGGAVTEHNCLNTDVILDITQKWWAGRKTTINRILMPSAVENYLVRIGAMQYFPETMTGFNENVPKFCNRQVTVTDQCPFWRTDIPTVDIYKYLFASNEDTRNEAIANHVMFMDGIEMM